MFSVVMITLTLSYHPFVDVFSTITQKSTNEISELFRLQQILDSCYLPYVLLAVLM